MKTKKFETLLKKELKSKQFNEKYNEELTRLSIANTIRELRNKKKITQEEFAEKISMPQSVIARAESGKHTISLNTLGKIAHALGKEIKLV